MSTVTNLIIKLQYPTLNNLKLGTVLQLKYIFKVFFYTYSTIY